jgi:hypothetical protein
MISGVLHLCKMKLGQAFTGDALIQHMLWLPVLLPLILAFTVALRRFVRRTPPGPERSFRSFSRYAFTGPMFREFRQEQEYEQVQAGLESAQHSSFETQELYCEKTPTTLV